MQKFVIPDFFRRHRDIVVVGLVVLTALAGCRAPAAAGWRASVPTTGSASFEIVSPESSAAAPSAQDAETDEESVQVVNIPGFIHAPAAQPAYPPEALAGNAGTHILFLTATFSPTGRLIDLQRSPTHVVLPHPFDEAFFDAAKTAIQQWEVDPVREVHWRVPADGGQRQYLGTETFTTTIEIKFTFHESGEVR